MIRIIFLNLFLILLTTYKRKQRTGPSFWEWFQLSRPRRSSLHSQAVTQFVNPFVCLSTKKKSAKLSVFHLSVRLKSAFLSVCLPENCQSVSKLSVYLKNVFPSVGLASLKDSGKHHFYLAVDESIGQSIRFQSIVQSVTQLVSVIANLLFDVSVRLWVGQSLY